ncbi:MAG: hypothetical protein AMXMBFR58_12790 [Phycisphaerae bacterium]
MQPTQADGRSMPPAAAASTGSGARPGYFLTTPTISASGPRGPRFAFFEDAFRPFYLLAAIFAAVAIPLWVVMWVYGVPSTAIPALFWHGHEMVFGFGVAVIIGFLFTAARNWTGLPLPSGVPLAFLVAMWLTARAGMFAFYGVAVAVIDVLLLLIVAVVLGIKFVRARNLGSIPLMAVLLSLCAANAVFHAAVLGTLTISPIAATEAGLLCVVLVELIIGGRVVPAFTASGAPGVRQFRSAALNWVAIAAATLAILADLLPVGPVPAGAVAVTAGLLLLVQSIGWNPIAALPKPMLWILHVSYAWIPVGLILLGLSRFTDVPRSAAIHALAVGSMGGLIIGMMTRTALGHCGMPVRAGRAEIASFFLIVVSVAARLTAALVPPVYNAGLVVAAGSWAAAFAIYAAAYGRRLVVKQAA